MKRKLTPWLVACTLATVGTVAACSGDIDMPGEAATAIDGTNGLIFPFIPLLPVYFRDDGQRTGMGKVELRRLLEDRERGDEVGRAAPELPFRLQLLVAFIDVVDHLVPDYPSSFLLQPLLNPENPPVSLEDGDVEARSRAVAGHVDGLLVRPCLLRAERLTVPPVQFPVPLRDEIHYIMHKNACYYDGYSAKVGNRLGGLVKISGKGERF